jgi:hypothetical protein
VIRSGQVLCHGRPDEVLRNPEARKYYFGEGMELAVRGRVPAAAPAAPLPPTPQSRLAALRNRLTGRHTLPPDEAA